MRSCVKKLTDQEALADIARNDRKDNWLRKIAIEKLADQNVLAEIANSNDVAKYTFTYEEELRTGTGDNDFVYGHVTRTFDLREIARKNLE